MKRASVERMKAKNGAKTLKTWLKFFACSLAGVIIANLLMDGFPILGMPEKEQVLSVQVEIAGRSAQVKPEELELACNLAGGLRHWGFSDLKSEPTVFLCYQMKDGSTIVVGADKDVIYKDGRYYRAKGGCGAFFEKVAQAM